MDYVRGFHKIDRTQIALVGGKGANLGELSRIDDVDVPDGFCVTTDAFRRIIAEMPSIEDRLERLSYLEVDDRAAITALSTEIRDALERYTIPEDMAAEIAESHTALGEDDAYAVRSSATAEDLPTASFAGQQDSYLKIVGSAAILEHVSRCWGSLFTERAVTYRLRNGIDHRAVHMAVVVQRMVPAQASGILFTADPVTSDRTVTSVDAGLGPGEALVSGTVNADGYKVRGGVVIDRSHETEQPVLSDAQLLELERLGRKLEAHFGCPQDIEWCLDENGFHIVQSRPITTLFPIPVAEDDENHVYVSVGHQQMMTDAMKPLGISVWKLTSPGAMCDAGGRLFVDVTRVLASPETRDGLVAALGSSDPLIGDALETVLSRDGFVRTHPGDESSAATKPDAPEPIETDPKIVTDLIAHGEARLEALKREIRTKSGSALVDFVEADLVGLRTNLFLPESMQVITAILETTEWLGDRMQEWLGEKNAADVLTQSVPHNVTSEMGLDLLDVADAVRPYPEVMAFLHHVDDGGFESAGFGDEQFLDELAQRAGGPRARAAFESYLDRYGMRCVGEIDITRPRWSERPTALVPTIVSNVANFEPGEAKRRFEDGVRAARNKADELLERLRQLPDGEAKAEETARMIDRLRTFAGYREYPKYAMVGHYFEYKKALLHEAQALVQAGALREPEDIFYLRLDELRELIQTRRPCDELIHERKDAFHSFQALRAPRVLTSDGEALTGTYRRDDVPDGALVGLAVSTGTVEGRARIVLDMTEANLETGDILVTAYTDPSWTPLFVAITGLVTEVGGLMTHGAVIAREYGLPAVVGVEDATTLIRDGQRIRVDGTNGYVQILPE
ncbi:MAG: phosphoenolpyruvate synthase [Rhodococcus sp.]|nr:phosphoenolpyruvate synthase [Rhodococcus sp. (in: high G+C Gram-positive bacteria)]